MYQNTYNNSCSCNLNQPCNCSKTQSIYNYQNPYQQTYPNYQIRNDRQYGSNRLIGGGVGGFAVPFALGFLSAPLFYRPNYYRPYPYYGPYYRPF